jgi:hypothetical protein
MGILKPLTGIIAVALATMMMSDHAGAQAMAEADAKAAVLQNLAAYVQWPGDRQQHDLVFGVLGPDRVLAALGGMQGTVVTGRRVQVRELRPEDDAAACDVIYVPATYAAAAAAIRRVGKAPVLIVGDGAQVLRDGAAVRMSIEGARIRLEIELSALDRAGLRMSSKVLSLSKVLRNGGLVNAPARP